MISNSTIQKIFEYSQIEEVVGDFVRLKKSGVNYKGLCPFHNEKTPSFMVNPAKNIFKCFGCGEAGNPVTFVMKHEHYSYPEALRYLAQKYAITVEEDDTGKEDVQQLEEKESLFNLNSFAQKYYTDKLFNSENGKKIVLSYLKERGMESTEINKFLLGYNPDIWDAFTQHAIDNGFSMATLEKSGLTIFKDTNKCFDRFKGRIIFPIQNLTGRIVGFGGRLIGKAEKRPKYVNSPETEIYNKSKVLYGLYQAKAKISSDDNCFLVEGYTDVIAMHKAKMENVVASSGTSLTKEQINLLKRYTQNITILFDGDAAGIKASFRGIDMILEEGMNVKVVSFPDGEDPDSFLRKHTSEEARTFIKENSIDFISFKTKRSLDEVKNDPIKKAELIKDIINTIAHIPDAISRALYVKNCSTLLDISEQALYSNLSKELRSRSRKKFNLSKGQEEDIVGDDIKPAEKQVPLNVDDSTDDEKNLIRFLLNYASDEIRFVKPEASHKSKKELREDDIYITQIAKYIVTEVNNDKLTFDNSLYQKIFDEITALVEKEEEINHTFFLNHTDEAIKKAAINFSMPPHELSQNWEEKHQIFVPKEETNKEHYVVWFLDNFKSRKLQRLLKENAEKLKNAKTEEEQNKLMDRQIFLMSVKNQIAKKWKRIFLK